MTTTTTLDVERVRSAFPSLSLGVAHFDSPGGSQTPSASPTRWRRRWSPAVQPRTVTDAELRAGRRHRRPGAIADLLGADPRGVVFGRSMTALTLDLARTLATDWGPGDEIVVTRLDHDANVRPWVIWAERVGATVRWLDFDPETAELADLETSCPRTPGWSPSPPPPTCSAPAPTSPRPAGRRMRSDALVYPDAVHLAPHTAVDLAPSAPTCWPARRTSSSARTSAPSPPPRHCWSGSPPTSCSPPVTRCPSGSSSAPCPTSCSPVSPPRRLHRRPVPGEATAPRPGHHLDGRRRGARGRPARPALAGWPGARASPATARLTAYADGAVLRRGPHRVRGPRARSPGPASTPRPATSTRSRPPPARSRRRRRRPRRALGVHQRGRVDRLVAGLDDLVRGR